MPPQFENQLNNQNPLNDAHQEDFPKWAKVLIIFLCILVAGFVAWFIFGGGRICCVLPEEEPENIVATDPTADWKTYRSEEYGVEFRYRSDWYVLGGTKQVPIIISSTGRPLSNGTFGDEIIIYEDQSYEKQFTPGNEAVVNQIISTIKFFSTTTSENSL